jgi:hypothetical protein
MDKAIMKRTKHPVINRSDQICQLHADIVGNLKMSLEKAIQIGELLTEQKKELKHGQWGHWIRKNVPFTQATAANYMRIYEHREEFKFKNDLNLSEAYGQLIISTEKKQNHEFDPSSDIVTIGRGYPPLEEQIRRINVQHREITPEPKSVYVEQYQEGEAEERIISIEKEEGKTISEEEAQFQHLQSELDSLKKIIHTTTHRIIKVSKLLEDTQVQELRGLKSYLHLHEISELTEAIQKLLDYFNLNYTDLPVLSELEDN